MNAKHQFKYTYNEGCEDFSPCEITFDMPGDVSIPQMLWNFECYLKACGFVFDGHLEVVPEEAYDLEDKIEEEPPYCCMGDTDEDECCNVPTKVEKKVKEFNEAIAKLDKEQLQKCMKKAYEMSGLEYEVKKNKWVHGMCNPPASDWANEKNNPDNCWNS